MSRNEMTPVPAAICRCGLCGNISPGIALFAIEEGDCKVPGVPGRGQAEHRHNLT